MENQYFLRGFNLDHGTDFSSFVDGVPVNFPTHAHGQGYMDLNWVIPELIDYVTFRKGPYYADAGDFSSAGTAAFHLVKTLPAGLAKVGIGQDASYHGYLYALFGPRKEGLYTGPHSLTRALCGKVSLLSAYRE